MAGTLKVDNHNSGRTTEWYNMSMNFIKKNFALILAFGLPLVLILVVALSTYLPSLFLSTSYNFIYSACTDGTNYYRNSCDNYLEKRYSVVGTRLVVHPVDLSQDLDNDGTPDFDEKYTERIFLHDTKKNESREISLAEAQAMTFNSLLTSPDGVTVSGHYDGSGGDFFFIFDGGSSSYGYYLTKGNSRDKLNLINNSNHYYYRNNFHFIGWVLPGRN